MILLLLLLFLPLKLMATTVQPRTTTTTTKNQLHQERSSFSCCFSWTAIITVVFSGWTGIMAKISVVFSGSTVIPVSVQNVQKFVPVILNGTTTVKRYAIVFFVLPLLSFGLKNCFQEIQLYISYPFFHSHHSFSLPIFPMKWISSLSCMSECNEPETNNPCFFCV